MLCALGAAKYILFQKANWMLPRTKVIFTGFVTCFGISWKTNLNNHPQTHRKAYYWASQDVCFRKHCGYFAALTSFFCFNKLGPFKNNLRISSFQFVKMAFIQLASLLCCPLSLP